LKYTSLVFLAAVCLYLSCSSKPHKQDTIVISPVIKNNFAFDFKNEVLLTSVLNIANQQNKMVFLDLNASWCTPCKMMQRDVYTHKPTAEFFNNHFVNYMVDVEVAEGPDLKLIFDINVMPSLLFLNANGRVVHKVEGALYHKDLLKNAEIALAKQAAKPN
jgi:thiol:disulfide interchange protein